MNLSYFKKFTLGYQKEETHSNYSVYIGESPVPNSIVLTIGHQGVILSRSEAAELEFLLHSFVADSQLPSEELDDEIQAP